MKTHVPSRTALTTSLIRAHHTRTAESPVHVDPWGDLLVPDEFKDQLVQWAFRDNHQSQSLDGAPARDAVLDAYLRGVPSYASVVLRARYAEDALEQSIGEGTRQYVQIGAGLDSYSIRRPGQGADVDVFELDHPATQSLKRDRLAGIAPPHHLLPHYVATDLSQETLAKALRRSAFDFHQPAFFSWLGVTIYLTEEENTSALRSIAECGVPGSLVVFTYVDRAIFANPESDPGFLRMQRNAAALGEPFKSGFDPEELGGLLRSCGLELLEDLDGCELGTRYAQQGEQAFAVPRHSHSHSHIALARVTQRDT